MAYLTAVIGFLTFPGESQPQQDKRNQAIIYDQFETDLVCCLRQYILRQQENQIGEITQIKGTKLSFTRLLVKIPNENKPNKGP
ncbi:Uncharacterised protein [Sphingobacterium daejeonense]|nr:Uncharacterised protein [Sphingobacterium daejeonense]